jgi:broad specificity phosphatase PhoE
MGILYLVRHGQASFGSADYDRLSPLGQRQCEALGAWFARRGIAFDAVFTGTLRVGYAVPLAPAQAHAGLDEFDGDAVVRAVHAGPLPAVSTPQAAQEHFRHLRDGLARWMAGSVQPQGMPPHAQFRAGVVAALDQVRSNHADGCTLVVSSGGPIALALGHAMGLPDAAVIDLNLQLRNSALCELRVTPRRLVPVSFNTLPHLEADAERAAWITHA